MKNLMKTSMLALVAIFLTSAISMAAVNSDNKTIDKARAAVSNAGPDDWETLAKSAQMCIKKGVNLTEAKEWLESSLAIQESAFGLEVAGDYYMANKLYRKAIMNYLKSMQTIKARDFYGDTSFLQAKIDNANKKK